MPSIAARDPVPSLERVIACFGTEPARVLAEGYAALSRGARDGAIPRKNGLDIAAFAPVLSHIVLCAVILGGPCVYRLAGDEMQRRIGFNPVGRDYYDFVPPARREAARAAMETAITVPCGFRAVVEQTYSRGLTRRIEALGLPLSSDERGVDGFLIFADSVLSGPDPLTYSDQTWLGANLVHRDWIDLGFGIGAARPYRRKA